MLTLDEAVDILRAYKKQLRFTYSLLAYHLSYYLQTNITVNKLTSILRSGNRDAELLCSIADFITQQRWHVEELESGDVVLRKRD